MRALLAAKIFGQTRSFDAVGTVEASNTIRPPASIDERVDPGVFPPMGQSRLLWDRVVRESERRERARAAPIQRRVRARVGARIRHFLGGASRAYRRWGGRRRRQRLSMQPLPLEGRGSSAPRAPGQGGR